MLLLEMRNVATVGGRIKQITWFHIFKAVLAGREPSFSMAVSAIGETLRNEGRTTAAIGYNISFSGYQASFNVRDPRYKVGAVGDFLLKYKFGIENTTTCAEGIRPGDEVRIIGRAPEGKTMAAYLPFDTARPLLSLMDIR